MESMDRKRTALVLYFIQEIFEVFSFLKKRALIYFSKKL